MIRDLMMHKAYANAAMMAAIRQHHPAKVDPEIRDLLHHILLANRFWLLSVRGLPFVVEEESRVSGTFDALVQRYRATHEQEAAWLATATEADFARVLENPRIPGGHCSVAQALMQVCMHSQGHRSQCAKMLRRHGGAMPTTDFILWVATRPPAEWG